MYVAWKFLKCLREREAGQGVSKCALGSERSEGLAWCPQEAVAGGERAGGSTGL